MNSKAQKNAPNEPAGPDASDVSTTTPKRPLVDSLREMIALVSTAAGVFAVLFYLAGRSFSNSYFDTMNIPSYQVSFSLWEYGEVAWVPLLYFPLSVIAILSFFTWVVFTLRDLLWPLLMRFLGKLSRKRQLKRPALNFPESSKAAQRSFLIWLLTMIGFLVIVFVISMMGLIGEAGRKAGQSSVLTKSAKVELISAIPLAFDDNNLASTNASGKNYYIYKGFHLLTFNNGKYYLFKAIDPVTCKPSKVYIIDPEKDIQVNLSAAESLTDQCQITNPPTVTATPFKTQSTPTP